MHRPGSQSEPKARKGRNLIACIASAATAAVTALCLCSAEKMTVGSPAGASGHPRNLQVRREREGEESRLRPGKESVKEETV